MEKETSIIVIEPEVLDEQGRPITPVPSVREGVHHRVGAMSGFLALAVSFILMVLGALFTIFIILPLMLLGRILGMQIKTFHR